MENPFKTVNADVLNKRERDLEILKKNRYVQNFLKKNNQDFSLVEDDSSLFVDWLDQIKECRGCKGLDFCPYRIKGMIKEPFIDDYGFLSDQFRNCKYKEAYLKENQYLQNYLVNHTGKEARSVYIDSLDVPQNDASYVCAFVKALQSKTQPKGIFLYGQPGTGKSYLLASLLNYYAKDEKKKVAFIKVPQLMQELKQNIKDEEFKNHMLNSMRRCDVLVLDDIGSESITPWTRDEILFPILDERMSKKKKTYFTSNYTPMELKKQYTLQQNNGQVAAMRFMERIQTLAEPVELTGTSRRQEILTTL